MILTSATQAISALCGVQPAGRGARRRSTALSSLGLLAVFVVGCASSSEQSSSDDSLPTPPGVAQVRQASARLHATLRAGLVDRWPARYVRSLDFPELPLTQRPPLRDLGAWAADRGVLEDALDAEVRREALLRLSRDEAAVPAWLRQDSPPSGEEGGLGEAPSASLILESWLSSKGQIGLRLREAGGEVVAESMSGAVGR